MAAPTRYAGTNPLPDELIVPTSQFGAYFSQYYIRAIASTYDLPASSRVLATGQRLNVDMVLQCIDRNKRPGSSHLRE